VSSRAEDRAVEATDLTPIPGLTGEDEAWLRQLAKDVDTNTLSLKLSQRRSVDTEPVVFFDERFGNWWAGRYIGEVQYQGRTLRILPRFGMPQLQRWLSRIWGVRLFSTKGRYERARVWLWELLAKLWESRLLAAAQHGLPTIRRDEIHRGQTIRGRLEMRLTAREFAAGRQRLVSRARSRNVDRHIGGIVVHAFEHLRQELRHLGDERSWLTQRGENLAAKLRGHITKQEAVEAAESCAPIRYTPITEGYRPVVELSQAISRQQPTSSSAGSNDVLGVLIDMAEVWELYVYHLLRSSLLGIEVIHTGREADPDDFLLRSDQTGERLGGLKPDILLLAPSTNRLLGVLDAKYKTTTPTPDRPHGILREDLYQMVAYLCAYGRRSESLYGGLVYPAGQGTSSIAGLQAKSPWRCSASEYRLWFFGLQCLSAGTSGIDLSPEEGAFIGAVRGALGQPVPLQLVG